MPGPKEDHTTLGRMRFLLRRLSLKQRAGGDPELDQDFEHLDEAFDPRVDMTPPPPRRGTPSWTRTETFQRFERNLIYIKHED